MSWSGPKLSVVAAGAQRISRIQLRRERAKPWWQTTGCVLVYIYVLIYIYRLKAGGSPELRGTLSLDAIPERSFLYTDGGVGGCNNVMWSALDDVESWKMLLGWKMLLRCKFRCCWQKGGGGWWGGCNNVMWSALDDGCSRSCQLLQTAFVDMKMKKVRS